VEATIRLISAEESSAAVIAVAQGIRSRYFELLSRLEDA
jgi:hypothetical protein